MLPRHARSGIGRKQQLVIIPAMQRIFQGRARTERQQRRVHLGAHARLLAKMLQIHRKPIADVDRRGRHFLPHQCTADLNPRLRKEMRMLRAAAVRLRNRAGGCAGVCFSDRVSARNSAAAPPSVPVT